jgi:hypothetical protein
MIEQFSNNQIFHLNPLNIAQILKILNWGALLW